MLDNIAEIINVPVVLIMKIEEDYILQRKAAEFSHGVCPECLTLFSKPARKFRIDKSPTLGCHSG